MKRPTFDLWPLYRGERFRDRFWRWVKHKLEHVRCYSILVGPEVAIYYPDACRGSLHHENWWALVKPDQLDDIAGHFASNEAGYHVCKHPKYNAKWFKKNPQVNVRFNPLANDEDISIPCGVCRSYSCCRPKEHGMLQSTSRQVDVIPLKESQMTDHERVQEFANWIGDRDNTKELFLYLIGLFCTRCGTPRPDIITLSKGGPWCCYPEVP